MPTESDTTSPVPLSNTGNMEKNSGNKLSTTAYDPTPYIQRARVTRPAPPKPSVNPLQFVQIKPCSLYQSAQEQLKKADEVKKVKEIKKEEPEDWQSNLDNWKSSRRKRVEHIIDRVVEVKKLEMEEHDRTRKKSKTFSEMLEERGSRRKMSTLPVYSEDEPNDMSDLGIGTSSASGKSSLSEDCDNQSVMSDTGDNEKLYGLENNSNQRECSSNREYISSPGYDTSTSTAPASTPDPCEYTYEGAIQDYKTRVSKAQSGYYNNGLRSTESNPQSKDSTPERTLSDHYVPRRSFDSKIEDRLLNFEGKSVNHNSEGNVPKKDLPKVNILKRRELFEKENTASNDINGQKRFSEDFSNSKSIRERLSSLEKSSVETKKQNRLSGDISNIKDRLQSLEKQPPPVTERHPKIEVPVMSLKDRLSSLQTVAVKEEVKKPVPLIGEHDLEMLRREEFEKQNALKREAFENEQLNSSHEILNIQDESNVDTDREDSGIHTTDVSCSVSQTDEQPDLVNEETHHDMNEDGLCTIQTESLQGDRTSAKSKLAKVQGTLPKNLDDLSAYSEAPVDQESSVSLSLSESPTASIQTVIFNDKLTNDAEDVANEKSNAVSQHLVEGIFGISRNVDCSNSPRSQSQCSPLTSSTKLTSTVGQKSQSNIKDNTHTSPSKKIGPKFSAGIPVVNDGNRHVVYDSKLRTTAKKEQLNSKAMEEVVKKCQEYLDTTEAVVPQTGPFEVQGKVVEPKIFKSNVTLDKSPTKLVATGNIKENISKISTSNSVKSPQVAEGNNIKLNVVKSISPTALEKQEEVVKKCQEYLDTTEESLPQTGRFEVPVKDMEPEISKINVIMVKSPDLSAKNVKTNTINTNTIKSNSSKVLEKAIESKTIPNSLKTSPISENVVLRHKESNPKTNSVNQCDERKSVVEICEKADVRDLPKAANVPTPFFDIDLKDESTKSPVKETNSVLNIVKEVEKESSQNQRTENQKNGVIVAKFEIVETTIKVTSSNENLPKSPTSSQTPEATSPTINQKTHPAAKPKNIFDFLKKNFSTNPEEEQTSSGAVSVDNSKFYVPLKGKESPNEVNIEITRTVKTEKIVEETESLDPELTITSEISQLLDEELAKLTVTEDTKL